MCVPMRWLDRLIGGYGRMAATTDAAQEPAPDAMAHALAAAQAGDYAQALALWEPLARAGVARAQNNIGACFAEGLGVAQDRNLARQWLKLAAEAGDPVGQRNYAAFHMQGLTGEDADYVQAAHFYRLAAEQDDAQAQDMLSWLLLEGEVIPSDPQEARRWAERAAAGGIASAMTRLGMLYHNALGVDRDPAEAARWWQKAALLDDADAQAMLGAALMMGAGVEGDKVQALAWIIRATQGGSALAQPFVGPARAALSAAEIAEAEARARAPLAGAAP